MAMSKEETILKKLFVALDDRTLDLEKVGQHLAGLPTSYALESLEEAMEHRALWAEQQRQRQEEIVQREREEYLASIPSPTAVALGECLVALVTVALVSCLIVVILSPWWWQG